jgi:FkbM family methyltransferase
MSIVSYAQNFEDVILWRALKHVGHGFYIDIGAQDPVIDSVSLAFYEQGWRGVHVEPTAHYASKLRCERPDEDVVEAAIGAQEGAITFFEIAETGLSTGDAMIAQTHEADGYNVKCLDVRCLALSKVLDTYKDREIHWLKIDVEGMEEQVIASWSPSPVRPWIVVVESTRPTSMEPSFDDWEPQLVVLGYQFVYFDGLNRFYVSRDHPELKTSFGPGPNVFDDFALSGFANAPFCRKVNVDTAALQHQLTERAEEAARLSHAVDAARAKAASQGATFSHATSAWERASTALTSEITLKNEAIAAREAEIARLNQRIAKMDAWGQAATARETALAQQLSAREAEIAVRDEDLATKDIELARINEATVARDAEIARFNQGLRTADERLAAVYRSTSWRMTAPIRGTKRAVRWLLTGTWSWITLKPGSRPRRVARKAVIGLAHRLRARPGGAAGAKPLLALFRSLGARLRVGATADQATGSWQDLTPQRSEIMDQKHRDLNIEPDDGGAIADQATERRDITPQHSEKHPTLNIEPDGVRRVYWSLLEAREKRGAQLGVTGP